MISPIINLIGNDLELRFFDSYQKYTNSIKQDTLQIFVSENCGDSFDYLIYEKGGDDLNTFDGNTENFIPSEANHWREEIINITNFSEQNILIKFVTTNFRGNNIFIDNININNENETSLTDLIHTNPKIYPNPSNNKIIPNLADQGWSIKALIKNRLRRTKVFYF